MEVSSADKQIVDPIITIEKEGQMMDLVGEEEIVAFLSTLKAPSPTLTNFYLHILKMKENLSKELQHIQSKISREPFMMDASLIWVDVLYCGIY
jgi:hypothetical protein